MSSRSFASACRLTSARILAAALLLVAGCGRQGGGGASGGEMIVRVVTHTGRRQPVDETISLVGTLEADELVEVKSELDGRIRTIAFEEGQPVRAGQLLIQLDTDKLQASLEEAEANLRLAEASRRRYEALAGTVAVSRQELDQAVAAAEASSAAVALLRAQLQDAAITAPFDGVVGERLVSPGQFVTKGQTLTFLVDADPMKAAVHAPERYLSQLREGHVVELRVAAYPDEPFRGTVAFIDPQLDEATRTALVKAAVPNPEGRLRSGMLATARLALRVRDQALVIPETALLQQGDVISVFIVGPDDVAQPRPVTAGLRIPGGVEITAGLTEGERVVVEGLQKLRPGAKVKTREAEQPFGGPSGPTIHGGS